MADRIAGALVDLAYQKETNPRIAVEVLIGHGDCAIIAETSVSLDKQDVCAAVKRISGIEYVTYKKFRKIAFYPQIRRQKFVVAITAYSRAFRRTTKKRNF